MALPSKAVMLAAYTRKDWRAVLGLSPFDVLTVKAGRLLRAQCHPDKGGDAEVAKIVGHAVDMILAVQERRQAQTSQHEQWAREARERREREEQQKEQQDVARKRKLAEAARERRKRARPAAEDVDAIIARLCEPCSINEASTVEAVRKALKAAGCNGTDLRGRGFDSSNRRQRHRGNERVYYFVYKFDQGELQPMKLREEP